MGQTDDNEAGGGDGCGKSGGRVLGHFATTEPVSDARVALVMTVRDEEELLRPNLLYHQYVGVDTAFVYDDGSTDRTAESVRDLSFVEFRPSVSADGFRQRPELDLFVRGVKTHISARQALNAVDAIDRARNAGIGWLISIDADELAVADLERGQRGDLRALLASQPDDVESVRFPPLEILQRRFEYENVMAEETLFKSSPAAFKRDTFDPFAGVNRRVDGFYGHENGKSALRLAVEARPRNMHQFVRLDGGKLRTRDVGHLLHYYCHSFDAFQKKFQLIHDHPDRHLLGGNVPIQKRLWRDVVNQSDLSDSQLRDYYRRWVMFDEGTVQSMMGKRRWGIFGAPAITEVTSVGEVFSAIGDTIPPRA
jgi:hypothetical protein